jgi:hypothetical protein
VVLAIRQVASSQSCKRAREPDGEEEFRRGRRDRDLDPLACGRSISEVAASLGVDRKTIRKYLAPAVAAGIQPGGPPVSPQQWALLVAGWFPHLADTQMDCLVLAGLGFRPELRKQHSGALRGP